MGWSATAAACDTLDAVSKVIGGEMSNGMPDGGFYEVGAERADGAITGVVWTPADKPGFVRKVGHFKIAPNGSIVRFPGLSRALRAKAMTAAGHAPRVIFINDGALGLPLAAG